MISTKRLFSLVITIALSMTSLFGQVQITATGSANAIEITHPSNITTLTAGLQFTFRAFANNSGPVTLNINSLGAIGIKKEVNQDLEADEIRTGQMVTVIYDGTNFQMTTLSGKTVATEASALSNPDTIKFDVGGITQAIITNGGRIEPSNPGSSVFLGENAGENDNNVANNGNVAIGFRASELNIGGEFNTAIGYRALTKNTNNNNTAVGANALFENTTGIGNMAFGANALRQNIDGNNNTGIGSSAIRNNTSGIENVAVGRFALFNNTIGNNNVALGDSAGDFNTSGAKNTFIGDNADATVNNLTNATAIGAGARVNTSNSLVLGDTTNVNVGIGTGSPQEALHLASGNMRISELANVGSSIALIDGAGNMDTVHLTNASEVLLGDGTFGSLAGGTPIEISDGDNNTRIQVEETANEDTIRFDIAGTEYLKMAGGRIETTNTGRSVFLGERAGANDDLTNNDNVFIGFEAGRQSNTTGQSVAIGYQALALGSFGTRNTAIGEQALRSAFGNDNTAVGARALLSQTNGGTNSAFGSSALRNVTSGSSNTSMGSNSSLNMVDGSFNTGIGERALSGTSSGDENTALGRRAGDTNGVGSRNTFIGSEADASTSSLTNATAIGAYAVVTASNSLVLGDTTNVNVGIGTGSPQERFHLGQGKLRISDLAGATGGVALIDTDGNIDTVRLTNPAEVLRGDGTFGPVTSFNTANAIPKGNGSGLVNSGIFSNATNQVTIGIATTLPNVKFAVVNQSSTLNFGGANFSNTPNQGSSHGLLRSRGTPGGGEAMLQDGDIVGTYGFNVWDGAGDFRQVASIEVTASENHITATNFGTEFNISTISNTNASPQNRIRIQDNGTIVLNDNTSIGVGPTTGAKLQISPDNGQAGALRINGESGNALTGELQFMELTANGTDFVGFRAPNDVLNPVVWELPNDDGNSNDVLQTDGSGVLSWGAPANDNLGNHTATQTLNLNGNYLSGDTDAEGIFIGTDGNVSIGIGTATWPLQVETTTELNAGYFKNIFNTASQITGIYGEATGSGSGDKYGGEFLAQNGSNSNNYGIRATGDGAAASTGSHYGGFFATLNGASTNYGVYSDAQGGSTAVGIWAKASGATTNYAGIFEGGNVGIGIVNPVTALHLAGTFTVEGNITFPSTADRRIEIQNNAAMAGHTLILKAGNTLSGSVVDDGGDLSLEAGNASNGSGGNIVLLPGTGGASTGTIRSEGDMVLPGSGSATRSLIFGDADNTQSTALRAPNNMKVDVTWVLPDTLGATGQVLSWNGLGELQWVSPPSGDFIIDGNNNHLSNLPPSISGIGNVVLGQNAGNGLTSANNTVLVGLNAGQQTSDATGTVSIGGSAGRDNVSGADNTFLGNRAGLTTTGAENTFLGSFAGDNNTSGIRNIMIGHQADVITPAGIDNSIAIGTAATTNASRAIAIGNLASASGQNSLSIGESSNASGDNAVAIGSLTTAPTDATIILGDGTNSNFNVGIGNNNPSEKLEVVGNTRVTGRINTDTLVVKNALVSTPHLENTDLTAYFTGAHANRLVMNADNFGGNISSIIPPAISTPDGFEMIIINIAANPFIVENNPNIFLANATDFSMSQGASLHLVFYDAVWYEIGRSER